MATPNRSVSSASQLVPAPAERVYAAFLDPTQLIEWLPPAGMTGRFHRFDAAVGGGYRMSLFYPEEHRDLGKSGAGEDVVEVRFRELVPAERIVETFVFATDDPSLQGEMTLTITFQEATGGTEVGMRFTDLPPGLRAEDNDEGARISLAQLAAFFERPGGDP